MKITDLLKTEGVSLKQAVTNKDAAIDLMVDLHDKAGNLYDRNEFRSEIMIRESAGSTAVGMGIAVPHAKSSAVKRQVLLPLQCRKEWITSQQTEYPAIFCL